MHMAVNDVGVPPPMTPGDTVTFFTHVQSSGDFHSVASQLIVVEPVDHLLLTVNVTVVPVRPVIVIGIDE